MIDGLVLGVVVAVFPLVNIDDVAVDWILGTWLTPLIVVIALSFIVGPSPGASPLPARRRAKR